MQEQVFDQLQHSHIAVCPNCWGQLQQDDACTMRTRFWKKIFISCFWIQDRHRFTSERKWTRTTSHHLRNSHLFSSDFLIHNVSGQKPHITHPADPVLSFKCQTLQHDKGTPQTYGSRPEGAPTRRLPSVSTDYRMVVHVDDDISRNRAHYFTWMHPFWPSLVLGAHKPCTRVCFRSFFIFYRNKPRPPFQPIMYIHINFWGIKERRNFLRSTWKLGPIENVVILSILKLLDCVSTIWIDQALAIFQGRLRFSTSKSWKNYASRDKNSGRSCH